MVHSTSFPDGFAICQQDNRHADTMFIMAVGVAVACKQSPMQGGEPGVAREADVPLRWYQSGDYFGELALMSNEPRSASVIAKGAVTCLTIGRKQFESLSFSTTFMDVLRRGKLRIESREQAVAAARERQALRRCAASALKRANYCAGARRALRPTLAGELPSHAGARYAPPLRRLALAFHQKEVRAALRWCSLAALGARWELFRPSGSQVPTCV